MAEQKGPQFMRALWLVSGLVYRDRHKQCNVACAATRIAPQLLGGRSQLCDRPRCGAKACKEAVAIHATACCPANTSAGPDFARNDLDVDLPKQRVIQVAIHATAVNTPTSHDGQGGRNSCDRR